ncbi:zinc ABC transporter substrate-binding protein [Marinobacter sp. SS21]|uniref:zinc ABC transporter substrate-binding protein n=1 Tax=Marinobacter sp. SS21 TaxID=2979460 RepID=UPI00232BB3ED|nr:zinc ABC transporter substrate-binding protein [Marinobacter sp. SS21]MDC0664342.1 zinc ABC transporter substrate-binding protein [Marinobacter sp. SS21]
MSLRPLLVPLVLAVSALSPLSTASAESRIVTSIKPLELLVRAIAPEDAEITSLVPAGASPHTYQMRPSQRRALEQADRIFWVGPELETFLERLLSGADFRQKQVALWDEQRDAGHHPAHQHEPDQAHHQAEDRHHETDHSTPGHQHGDGEDPHVWLDPGLALEMAETIRHHLEDLPGVEQEQLRLNYERFAQELEAAETDIRQRLSGARHMALFTYHDAFRRFAEHYGLDVQGVLTLNPERSPGARHITLLQQQLQRSENVCLLMEPQFNRQWWRSITEGIDLNISTWDPLAADIDTTAQGYIQFQYALAEAVLACLPQQTEH